MLKSKLYQLVPAIPRFNLTVGQKLYFWKVRRGRKKVIKTLQNQTGLYANIGCGGSGLANGWVNIDWGKYENVTYTFDCRKSLPFANNSAKGIYTEHFFEHLDHIHEVPFFLLSCYQSLENGGTLRIVIPDAGKYLKGYVSDGWDMLKQTRPLDDELNDELMGIRYETKMQLINEVFRQSGEHKYAWDFETLELSLKKAGFTKIYQMNYMHSHDELMQIDQSIRQHESLYVEAIK